MRLLVVSQYFFPEGFRINELVQALSRQNIEVEVLTGKPNYPQGVTFDGYRAWGFMREAYQGLQIHRLPLIPRGKSSAQLALNYLSFVISGILFGPRLLRDRHYDVIFVYAPSPILQAIPAIGLGRLKKCPVVLWVQDLWPESLSATKHITRPSVLKTVEHVVRWIYRKVDLLLVQSKYFIPMVRPLAGSTPIIYYPNSFVGDLPRSKPLHVVCPELDCAFPVLFAGNIGTAQAVGVILGAAELLKEITDIRIVMVGEGSRREWMMQQAAKRELTNLVFPGRFPFEMMPELMARSAALLLTLADSEIFRLTIPSKVQAYLAAGRPIVACLNGAGADVVREAEAGIVVTAEDSSGLAQAIRSLYGLSAEERVTLGNKGRRYYEKHFSQEKLVNELIRHLEQAVSHYRGEAS